MGWGYLPAMVNAAIGGDGYGNALGMTWHENVSLRGIVLKAFGYLESAGSQHRSIRPYPLGYYVQAAAGSASRRRALLAVAVEADRRVVGAA